VNPCCSSLSDLCVQRYEAASTLYGPHTLKAYAELFSSMVLPLLNGSGASLPRGPQPPNLIAENMKVSLLPPPGLDGLPLLKKFGGVLVQPKPSYTLPACAKPGANATTVEVSMLLFLLLLCAILAAASTAADPCCFKSR